MSKEKTIFSLENDFEKIGNKYDKNRLNISFNRVAFIFFTFVLVLFIFSLKALYLTGKKLPENSIGSSKNENKIFEILNKKIIIPSAEEIKKNPPSRSAKLRYVRKVKESANFEEFLSKFKNLIEIENIGKKLC